MRGAHGLALMMVLAVARPANAQSWAPVATDVFSRLAWASASVRDTWRGIERGSAELSAGAAASWGGPGAGTNALVLIADAKTALGSRTSVSDLLHAGVVIVHQLSDDNDVIWVAADLFDLPSATTRASTAEISGGVRVRVPVWLPERRPVLLVEGATDLSRYRAQYLRTALRLDYKFQPTMGAFIEGGQAWSGLPGGELIGSVPFGNHGTDLTLTVVIQKDLSSRTLSLEPFVRGLWITRNADPNRFDSGLRATLVY